MSNIVRKTKKFFDILKSDEFTKILREIEMNIC